MSFRFVVNPQIRYGTLLLGDNIGKETPYIITLGLKQF